MSEISLHRATIEFTSAGAGPVPLLDSGKTASKVSTNEKSTLVSSPFFEATSKVINKATNFSAKQVSSARADIKQIFSDFKETQKDIAIQKKITYYQKQIDSKFKEIKELEKSKDPTAPGQIKELKKQIDLCAVIIKVTKPEQKVFEQIAQGKAKMVYREYKITNSYKDGTTLKTKYNENYEELKSFKNDISYNDKNVFLTPVGNNFVTKNLRESEIREENKTGNKIKEKLNPDGENYLSIDMEEMNEPESQKNKDYTVRTSLAQGDLKGAIKKGTLEFPVSAKIGLHILKGMSNLHEAGYVHGDGKNDNVLLVKVKDKDGNEELTGRIADLGKTRKMNSNENGIMFGNPRFAAPEGNLSHSAEIYTTALLIINTLEGEFLNIEGGDDMIISPAETDPNANAQGKFGIEKFLLLNKKCPQTDNTTFFKRVKIMGQEIKNQMIGSSNTAQLREAQKQTDQYIDNLVLRLIAKNGASSTLELEKLGNLLKAMTVAQVSGNEPRPSLKSVIPEYEAILKNLTPS